jgi:putative Ca2+/H+ antiporter (TMEM165/GDT1 family)
MDWKLLATTFTAVFLAELGDKTQIATLGFAAGTEKGHLSVFVGSALALVACSALAVVAGAALGKVVPMHWLERVGGAILVVAGVWTIWKSFSAGE